MKHINKYKYIFKIQLITRRFENSFKQNSQNSCQERNRKVQVFTKTSLHISKPGTLCRQVVLRLVTEVYTQYTVREHNTHTHTAYTKKRDSYTLTKQRNLFIGTTSEYKSGSTQQVWTET